MKKIALFTLLALTLATFGVGSAYATGNEIYVGTDLMKDTTGGQAPVTQAVWSMNPTKDVNGKYVGTDASTDSGAQFMPSGQYQVNTTIAICAIASDPDGLANVNNVYADVFYPEGIAVGTSHVKLLSQTGSSTAGCGVLMQQDVLSKLTKVDGYNLFCNNIRFNNTNLPTINTAYTYETICKADGTLQKEEAAVYCYEKEISYEDPSGSYAVWGVTQDQVGLQGILKSSFTYLPVTAFETDFSKVHYGNVRFATEKIISGDLAWDETGYPETNKSSIRNVGNTRASIAINQDDMGFGKSSGLYNVSYRARIGNNETDWAVYDPYVTTTLKKSLDLSELNEIDYAITVKKFPSASELYAGTMVLTATDAGHLVCQ